MTENPHPKYSHEWHAFKLERIKRLVEARKQTLTPYQQTLRERAAVLIERHQEKKPRRRFWQRMVS